MSKLVMKNNINSELAITHADNKPAKSIIGTDIAVAVDTINDFPLDANDGDTVIVRDLNIGGTFIYDSSKVAEHNDGTNFNGWIRQYSGAINVKWFGATTNEDVTDKIQRALDIGGNIIIDEIYLVSNNSSFPGISGALGVGAACLNISKDTRLIGNGGLKLIDGAGADEGAILSNPLNPDLDATIIVDIELDGNRGNTVGTMSGILLTGTKLLELRESCYIHDVSLYGAMSRPSPSQSGLTTNKFHIHYPRIERCGYIGLQGTRCAEFIHHGSNIKDILYNSIDVYGNDPSGGGNDNGFFGTCIIANPIIDTSGTGIFIESFSNYIIQGGDVKAQTGVFLNRINTAANRGRIDGVTFRGVDETTSIGIKFKNCSFNSVDNNRFENMYASIRVESGSERNYIGSGNTHYNITRYIVDQGSGTNSIVKTTIKDQYIYEEYRIDSAYPQLTKPLDHYDYKDSYYKLNTGSLYSIANKAPFLNNMTKFESVLTSPSGWSGAYSIYNVNGDGETRINTSPDIGGIAYVTINNEIYRTSGSGTAGEYYIRKYNSVSGTFDSGDYSTELNKAYTVYVKYDEFFNFTVTEKSILTSPSGWNAYSIYNFGSDGETRINTSPDLTIPCTVTIENNMYEVVSSGTSGEYYVRQYDGSSFVSGDYTSDLNDAYIVYVR